MRAIILAFILVINFSYAVDKDYEIGKKLVQQYNCLSCHDFSQKRTGPSFAEIAKKYGTSEEAVEKVAKIIINPPTFMPPFKISFEKAKAIARYVLIEGSKAKEKNKNIYEDYLDLESQFH